MRRSLCREMRQRGRGREEEGEEKRKKANCLCSRFRLWRCRLNCWPLLSAHGRSALPHSLCVCAAATAAMKIIQTTDYVEIPSDGKRAGRLFFSLCVLCVCCVCVCVCMCVCVCVAGALQGLTADATSEAAVGRAVGQASCCFRLPRLLFRRMAVTGHRRHSLATRTHTHTHTPHSSLLSLCLSVWRQRVCPAVARRLTVLSRSPPPISLVLSLYLPPRLAVLLYPVRSLCPSSPSATALDTSTAARPFLPSTLLHPPTSPPPLSPPPPPHSHRHAEPPHGHRQGQARRARAQLPPRAARDHQGRRHQAPRRRLVRQPEGEG